MSSVQQTVRVPGLCFSCGEMGHLHAHCPRTAGGSVADQRKWYPVFDMTECAVCEAAQNMCMESLDDVGDESVNSMHFCRGEKEMVLSDEWQVESDDVCAWELETRDAIAATQVKGRLKQRLSFRRDELKAPAYILDVIENDYVLPLISEPTQFVGKNHAFAGANKVFVDESVEELLSAGCIWQVACALHVCSPLTWSRAKVGK